MRRGNRLAFKEWISHGNKRQSIGNIVNGVVTGLYEERY